MATTVNISEKLGCTVAEPSPQFFWSANYRLPLGIVHSRYCQVFISIERLSLRLLFLLTFFLLWLLLLPLVSVVFRFLLFLFLLNNNDNKLILRSLLQDNLGKPTPEWNGLALVDQPCWSPMSSWQVCYSAFTSGSNEEMLILPPRADLVLDATGKGKGLDTCYSATYMSQTRD